MTAGRLLHGALTVLRVVPYLSSVLVLRLVLSRVVSETVHPVHVSLWLREARR